MDRRADPEAAARQATPSPATPSPATPSPATPHATPGDRAAVRGILYALLAGVVIVGLSFEFVDRPVALFVHALLPPQADTLRATLRAMTRLPELLGALALVMIIGLGLLRLAQGGVAGLAELGFLASLSLIVAETIKTALKQICGRTWPETWVNNNPSFIRDGVYGFFPFHGGPGWMSFPSGHTTAVCAVMAVIWLQRPGWRPVCVLAVAATVIGLIGMDYHFVSDVIAGGFLGSMVGVATAKIGCSSR